MTLNNYTKEELIAVINRLSLSDKSRLERILHDIEYDRVRKKIDKAEKLAEIANENRKKYAEFLEKYQRVKITDIPVCEIEEADKYLATAKKADKEWNKLMKEVDAYGFDKETLKSRRAKNDN